MTTKSRFERTPIFRKCRRCEVSLARLVPRGIAVWSIEYRGLGEPGGGYPGTFQDVNAALDMLSVQAKGRLDIDFGRSSAASNGKIGVVGFSWGGWKSFAFATHRKGLSAVFVFYGTGPADVTTINAPVYGFYGGNDGDVTGSVPGTTDAMKAAGKFYDPVMYEGADHGFMRLGDDFISSSHANRTARNQAFARLVTLLREMGTH